MKTDGRNLGAPHFSATTVRLARAAFAMDNGGANAWYKDAMQLTSVPLAPSVRSVRARTSISRRSVSSSSLVSRGHRAPRLNARSSDADDPPPPPALLLLAETPTRRVRVRAGREEDARSRRARAGCVRVPASLPSPPPSRARASRRRGTDSNVGTLPLTRSTVGRRRPVVRPRRGGPDERRGERGHESRPLRRRRHRARGRQVRERAACARRPGSSPSTPSPRSSTRSSAAASRRARSPNSAGARASARRRCASSCAPACRSRTRSAGTTARRCTWTRRGRSWRSAPRKSREATAQPPPVGVERVEPRGRGGWRTRWRRSRRSAMLERVHLFRCHEVTELLAVLEALPAYVQGARRAARWWWTRWRSTSGRTSGTWRCAPPILAKMTQPAAWQLASENALAVVTVNQVTVKPGAESGGGARLVPALGESYAHACATRDHPLRWEDDTRVAYLYKTSAAAAGARAVHGDARGVCGTCEGTKRPARVTTTRDDDDDVSRLPRLISTRALTSIRRT